MNSDEDISIVNENDNTESDSDEEDSKDFIFKE